MKNRFNISGLKALTAGVLMVLLSITVVYAADVITNGTFDTDLSDWVVGIQTGNGTRAWDNTVYGVASGSMRYMTNSGRRQEIRLNDSIYISQSINLSDPVLLSFYWYKTASGVTADRSDITVFAIAPDGSEVELWSDTQAPNAGQVLDGNVVDLSVGSSFDQTGNYYLRIYARLRSGNAAGAITQFNIDDIVLDVPVGANNAPSVVTGATAVSATPINRIGANTTTISTSFSDADVPGVGAFTCTFRIRDNVSTEYTLVNNLPNGSGGLTISDDGGGDYTASYTYDPGDAQTVGDYDLYFEVSDGSQNAIDGYAGNDNELNIYQQVAPSIVAGATTVSPVTVNRLGTDSTVISATFTDVDEPGVGAFTGTFRIRDGLLAELTLVNNQPHGGGGLIISDGGGGSYTARYIYNPDDAQTVDLYDLYFEVSDGTDNAIDNYADNDNELDIVDLPANNTPAITPGATQASVSPVNRYSTNTTVLSAAFSDTDIPGVGAFNCTFKIRDTAGTEYILVNNQPNGGGGLTITDGGSGNYTASYTYNPDDAQIKGLYDLHFEVTDGADTGIDGYANNTDELEINEILPPTPPTVSPGASSVSPAVVDRLGTDSTVIRANFTDVNEHPVATFNCTFKIREPNNIAELTLVNNQTHGAGGLTITDNGGGSYTAEYTYNPDVAQTLGLYDLYFEVTDGSTPAVDDYGNNDNELQITEVIVNSPPQIADSATQVSPGSIDRVGAATTTFSVSFTDADDPEINAFTVTFKAAAPQGQGIPVIADALQHGVGGLSISADGGNTYTATIAWDPADNSVLGYYDLYAEVSDGYATDIDQFANNLDELLLTNGGENAPPVVQSDAVYATPAGVARVGANPTTLLATFQDGDAPAVTAFRVNFSVREPDDLTVVALATNAADGEQGVSIADLGGGIYTASVTWDPADTDTLGFWDLYFDVNDGTDTSYDGFQNNLDELELYDPFSNTAPSMTVDTTYALPNSVNRIGSEYTFLRAAFGDADMPGRGAFTISFKVRDPVGGEVVVVNAAKHGEQGLRVVNRGAGLYEASVLWNPDVANPTGLYDLQFEVSDGIAATLVDSYTSNTDELTVTSSAVLGDGYLLHRTNDAAMCGDSINACHDVMDHEGQNCRVCHTPHATTNIYLIRDTIQTPSSGPKEVIFKTLGIGDPYNDPDPVVGDPTSGVMADSTDDVYTGVCEVCHVDPTGHHRNDGSQPGPNHNDALDCTSCHPHSGGFLPSGGGESGGGQACACHSAIFNPMNTSTTSYHHQLSGNSPDYTISAKTCLQCHVDHNIFRPDLNVGFGSRASNLRRDTSTTVVQGSSAVLLNSDYESGGSGGICLSCHVNTQTKGYVQPDGTTQTPAIVKADFDAATTAHNYNATSTFNSDGSTFNGNCVKCHNDDMSKSYQNSTNKFSVHDGSYRRIQAALGIASPSDPLEEGMCLQCHSASGDYYGVQTMSSSATGIQTAFSRTYTHPTTTYSGRHQPIETGAELDSLNRHAECVDCHNPHAAQQGTHDGSTSLVSNALKGAWGVQPDAWPAAPSADSNNNVFVAPVSFSRVEDASLAEWMICLKCHSNYTDLPTGARNLAAEINPNYPSTHGITIAGQNPYCNTSTMNEPWASSGLTWCSDCHRSDNVSDPNGPHGSNNQYLLVATIVSDDAVGTPLCYVCHSESNYWSGSDVGRYGRHPSAQGNHKQPPGCFACHMWDYAGTSGLGVQTVDDYLNTGDLFVHGQNKYWNYNEEDGAAGSGDSVVSFLNGYLANVDYQTGDCWAQTCKNHSPQNYGAP